MNRSTTTDLGFCHEDDLDIFIKSYYSTSGDKPVFMYYSDDEETYFISTTPITVERIIAEFPNKFRYIING